MNTCAFVPAAVNKAVRSVDVSRYSIPSFGRLITVIGMGKRARELLRVRERKIFNLRTHPFHSFPLVLAQSLATGCHVFDDQTEKLVEV